MSPHARPAHRDPHLAPPEVRPARPDHRGRRRRSVALALAAVLILQPSATASRQAVPVPPAQDAAHPDDAVRLDDAVRPDVQDTWTAPVPGPVVARYDPPARPWLPGHRGIDLAAVPGETVVAPASGVVSFAAPVAGRPVLVVTHGGLRSTLEPIEATVDFGTTVRPGDPVGTLAHDGASHCAPADCLHWGVRRDEAYLDPLALLDRAPPIVLLPVG